SRALMVATPLRLGTSRGPFSTDRGVSHSAACQQAQDGWEYSRALMVATPLRLGTSRGPPAKNRCVPGERRYFRYAQSIFLTELVYFRAGLPADCKTRPPFACLFAA